MKKAFPYIVIILIIFTASLEIYAFNYLNRTRIAKASAYYEESKIASNEEKALLLLKSNFLAPNKAKKAELINFYLEKGDFNKAEKYLKQDRSQSGLSKYAEAALETANFTKAEEIINKIADREVKDEYLLFLGFAKGNSESLKNLSQTPQTNVGRLLKAINTEIYNKDGLNSVLGRKVQEIGQKYQNKTAKLEIAKLMKDFKQYRISLYILDELEVKDVNLIDLFVLKAENYAKLNNHKAALENQKKAIKIAPENILLYETATNYARAAGNLTESDYLSDQIRALELIQK